jgi:hypothetical protein
MEGIQTSRNMYQQMLEETKNKETSKADNVEL